MTPKPKFFIVGAPKSGTTAMYEYLRQHPDIFMPHIKELHHFGADIQVRSPIVAKRKDLDVYLSYFKAWNGEKQIGEASVHYLFSKYAAQEIYDFDPNAKNIIMLRDPVSMLYSWYWQLRFNGEETLETFEAALKAEERRKQGQDIPEDTNWVNTLYYSDIVRYTEQIKRYFDIFGREQVHIILFDDFKNDVQDVYRNLLAFLEVDVDFTPDFPIVNANKVVRNEKLRNFLTYPPEWYLTMLSLGKKVLPHQIRAYVNKGIKSFNTIPTKREAMNPETRTRLIATFKDEIIALGALLERDLSHWYQA